MRKSRVVRFDPNPKLAKFELVDNELIVHDAVKTGIEELLPLLVKEKRAKKHLKAIDLVISWKTVADKLLTRSVDDIRNFWTVKILPLFDSQALIKEKVWSEKEDIDLLQKIVDLDHHDSGEQIDFDEIINERSGEENKIRWALLLKGVGSICPGMRYSPSETALKLKTLVETKNERYVQQAMKPASKRTGQQSYFNIVEYFKTTY